MQVEYKLTPGTLTIAKTVTDKAGNTAKCTVTFKVGDVINGHGWWGMLSWPRVVDCGGLQLLYQPAHHNTSIYYL